MSAHSFTIAIARVRHRGRRREESGFALLATLLILGASTMIVMGLLAYTMTTVSYAADQALRDEQVQAADGAMETLVNQIANDTTQRLGSMTSPCTPDLQTHDPALAASKFTYTIDGTPIEVQCFPEESNGPKDPTSTDVADVINVVGTTGARAANDCSGASTTATGTTALDPSFFACADWTAALGSSATPASVPTDGPTAKSVTHSGSGPLWFTANVMRVATGAAGVRDSASCSSASPLCPAIGVTGTYTQGGNGLFKNLDSNPSNDKACGVLQQDSTVPAAQVVTRIANRTLCATSGLAAQLSALGTDVVPDPPTDNSGVVVGTPDWVQSHRVTTLGRPDLAGAPGVAFSPNYVDSAGRYVSGSTCPLGANRVISLLPGAYTRDIMAVLSKWMSGRPYCGVSNGSVGVTFWFQPGYYWFDMNDVDYPLLTEALGSGAGGRYEINMAGARNFYVFGTPRVPLAEISRFTAAPLCDQAQPGVSITLSQRTSIRHLRGRAAICGISGKPAIYQGTTVNGGWEANPTLVKTGVSAKSNTYVANYESEFTSLFDLNRYKQLGSDRPFNDNTSAASPINLVVRCDRSDEIATWDDLFDTKPKCRSQSVLELGPGDRWGGTSPGHVAISSANIELTGTAKDAEDTTWSPAPSTTLGVYLEGTPDTSPPDCAVYYNGVPNRGATVAFDLLDPTRQAPAGIPPCNSVVKFADQLYNARVRVVFNSRSWICYVSCSLTVGSIGVTISKVQVSAAWQPAGPALLCASGSEGDYPTRTLCKSKDNTAAGAVRRSSALDVAKARGQASMSVNCNSPSVSYSILDPLHWFPRYSDECAAQNANDKWLTKTFDYPINDLVSPDFLASGGSTPAVNSLRLSVKGTSYCRKVRENGGVDSFGTIFDPAYWSGWPESCGPMDKSKSDDNATAAYQQQIADWNTQPFSRSFYGFKNWWRLSEQSTVVATVVDRTGATLCSSASSPIAEHDETRVLTIGSASLGGCATAENLVGATVKVTMKIRRGDFSGLDRYLMGCRNGDDGNNCLEWGYNLDWVGVSATLGSGTGSAAYDGPPQANRVTQSLTSRYSRNDATFNVYGQVVLPKADLEVAWTGPSTGKPIIEGPAPGGQPTLVVRSIASVTAKIPADISPIPEVAADSTPAVGVICCSQYRQDVRRVRIVARLTGAATNNPNGLVGTALVEVVDQTDKQYPRVDVLDWRLCNRGNVGTCDG